jgi:undecaprenyl-diphosphatase
LWDLTEALVAGFLQGVLEWLPISSRGSLSVFLVSFFGADPAEALAGSLYLHFGTALAGFIYFRREIWSILLRRREEDRAMFGYLFVSTAFIQRASRSMAQGGTERGVKPLDGVLMGAVQGFSAVPGLSRSGLTTSVLLMRGYGGAEAFRVSFLMSIPASVASSAGLLILRGSWGFDAYTAVGIAVACVVGYASMSALLRLARGASFWRLCLAMGAIILLSLIPSLLPRL